MCLLDSIISLFVMIAVHVNSKSDLFSTLTNNKMLVYLISFPITAFQISLRNILD